MKPLTLKQIIEDKQPTQFLFDASGVLYNKADSLIDGALETINQIRKRNINICLLTNNSKHSPEHIIKWFKPHGVEFKEHEIISSGLGLHWSDSIQKTIENKVCFVQGANSSYPYVNLAKPKKITSNINDAEVIICTSFDSADEENYFDRIKNFLLKNPKTPIICCNPDKYIHNEEAIRPVVGYWVHKLEKETKTKAQWFGKPYPDMYHLVNDHLKKHFKKEIDKGTWFFDDNPLNIQNFVDTYPTANGVFTHKTGLKYKESKNTIKELFPRVPYTVKSIGYLSEN